jgi:hypothetical protein
MLTFKQLQYDISLPIYVKTYFRNVKIDQATLDKYKTRLTSMTTAPLSYQSLTKQYKDTLMQLYVMLYSALETYNIYQSKGIGYDIFIDTMKAFSRFMLETKKKSGIYQFDRGFWIYRQLSAVLFRLGSLEYEIAKLEGEDVISIHIPSDALLTKDAIAESLKQSKTFFKAYFNIEGYRYYCKSWLLSPRLKDVLNPDARLLIFQSFFEDYTFYEDDLQCLYWVFDTRDQDFSKLKTDTTLQKNLKAYLLKGNKIGSAKAFIKPL